MNNYSERIKDADMKTAIKEALKPGSTGGNEWRLPDGGLLDLIKSIGSEAVEKATRLGEAPDVIDATADLAYRYGQVVDGYYDIDNYNELKSVCIEHPYDDEAKGVPYTVIFYTDPTDEEGEDDYHPFWASDVVDTAYGTEWPDGNYWDITDAISCLMGDVNGYIAEIAQAAGV